MLSSFPLNLKVKFKKNVFFQNNVVGCFTRLSQLLSSGGYTMDEQTLVGCPSPEQAYILVSSATLLQPTSRKTSTEVPPSASSAQASILKTEISSVIPQPVNPAQPSDEKLSTEESSAARQTSPVVKTSGEIAPAEPQTATLASNYGTSTEISAPKSQPLMPV